MLLNNYIFYMKYDNPNASIMVYISSLINSEYRGCAVLIFRHRIFLLNN
jgi:hypothetical protein